MAQVTAGWHVEDIKAGLRKRFGSLNDLANSWGLHRGAISATLNRAHYSNPVERKIAEAIGFPPHVIWPDRWHSDGTPKRRARSARVVGITADATTNCTPLQCTHRQKRDAA